MARLIDKESTYKMKIEINKDEVLNDILKIKKEVKACVKECDFELNKINLKRKDILVVKLQGMFKRKDIESIEKYLKKKLRRKVLVIDNRIELAVI